MHVVLTCPPTPSQLHTHQSPTHFPPQEKKHKLSERRVYNANAKSNVNIPKHVLRTRTSSRIIQKASLLNGMNHFFPTCVRGLLKQQALALEGPTAAYTEISTKTK